MVIRGYMSQLGPIEVPFKSWDGVYENPFFVADPGYVAKLEEFMDKLRKSGDSVGAKITTVASNVPVGWGEPVYDKLDADLAYNMMSINAVKGVEIGAGFAAVTQKGTEHSDEMTPQGFLTNNAGGILGGISTGQDIVVHVAVKPTSSIRLARRTIDVAGKASVIETHGRHDPCVGIRATPICEAMMALDADGPRAAPSRAERGRRVRDTAHRRAGAGRSHRAVCARRRPSRTPSPTKRRAQALGFVTQHLPYRRLAGFYFFYFAYLGTFAPFFSLYLDSIGLTPFDIGVLMALPQVTRIVAPHLWSWLADRSSAPVRVVRLTGLAGTVVFLAVFAGTSFALLFRDAASR